MAALLKEISFSRNGSTRFLIFLVTGTVLFGCATWYALNKKPAYHSHAFSHLHEDIHESLTLHGSDTLSYKLIPSLVEAWLDSRNIEDIDTSKSKNVTTISYYMEEGEKGIVTLLSSDSSSGFLGSEKHPNTGLLKKHCDIAMSSREATDTELKKLKEAGLGQLTSEETRFPIAIDGLILLVHPSCELSTITLENLAKIYSGEITNWAELGGSDLAIKPFNWNPTSATYQTFYNEVLSPYGHHEGLVTGEFMGSSQIIDTLLKTNGSIGYASSSIKTSSLKTLEIQACDECLSIFPDAMTIRTLEYPLSRTMFLYAPIERSEIASSFLNFIKSETANQIIHNTGFMKSQGIEVEMQEAENYQNSLFASTTTIPDTLRGLALYWDRSKTAVSLYQESNSHNLDANSEKNLGLIFQLLNKEEYQNYEVILVGHSCSSLGNLKKNDAETMLIRMRRRFQRRVPNNIHISNQEDKIMIADPRSLAGRTKNRRVDVWIRETENNTENKSEDQ